jgi:parvulin-like peptidyl-prolyl isomerase
MRLFSKKRTLPTPAPIKIALGALAVVFVLSALSERSASGVIVERVVAVVNDDVILLSEVNERVRPFLKKIMRIRDEKAQERALRRVQRQQLGQLIEEKLILAEAARRKLKVSDAEVNRAIQSVMKQNDVSYEELMEALEAQGFSRAQYKANLRKQILRLKVLNMAVRSRISVSEDDVKAFYQKQKRRLGVQLRVKVSLIRFGVPVTGPDREQKLQLARNKAQEAAKRLDEKPEEFGLLARRLSDHPSAPKGGLLGFVDRGQLQPAVEQVAFAASPDPQKVLGPVEADDGVYLVQVLDRQESEALPFDQVKDKLQRQLFQERLKQQTKQWLDELKKKAYIDIKL